MWKFKNPIRHAIAETRWPTAKEAESSRLFQPVRIGPVELESRTWVPAMVPWRATDEGFVTQDNLDWYRRFAAGQPGVEPYADDHAGHGSRDAGSAAPSGHSVGPPGKRTHLPRSAQSCQ